MGRERATERVAGGSGVEGDDDEGDDGNCYDEEDEETGLVDRVAGPPSAAGVGHRGGVR